jgi:hypothetical protein
MAKAIVAGYALRVARSIFNSQLETHNSQQVLIIYYTRSKFQEYNTPKLRHSNPSLSIPALTTVGIFEHIFVNPRLLKNFIILKYFNYKSITSYYDNLFNLLFLFIRLLPFHIHICNNNDRL